MLCCNMGLASDQPHLQASTVAARTECGDHGHEVHTHGSMHSVLTCVKLLQDLGNGPLKVL